MPRLAFLNMFPHQRRYQYVYLLREREKGTKRVRLIKWVLIPMNMYGKSTNYKLQQIKTLVTLRIYFSLQGLVYVRFWL